MKKLIYISLFIGASWYYWSEPGEVSYGPGVFAPKVPVQTSTDPATSFAFRDYTLTPLADFELTAKVLAKRNYTLGREAHLSPTDLALGWGSMSDEQVLESLEITQSGRWYRWRGISQELPLPREEIETHSANMHIIPKDDMVEYELSRVAKGDIVRLSGTLVRADAADGWRWVSSLTRADTGSGACEVFFVERLVIENL